MMETKDKLRALSKKKPLKNNPEEKSWKKNLQKSLKHSKKSLKNPGKNDVINVNDPDSRFLWLIKKGKMGNLDYNGQIAVDSHKRIILASYITIQYNRPLRTCFIKWNKYNQI